METPWNNWFSENGIMDDANLLRQWEITSCDQEIPQVAPALAGRSGFRHSLSSDESHTSRPFHHQHPVGGTSQPAFVNAGSKMSAAPEIISWNFLASGKMDLDGSSSAPDLLPGGLAAKPIREKEMRVSIPLGSSSEQKHETLVQRTTLAQAQEHIIAERNRREKLNQKFIALAAIIPGLKKADKASVLGDAVRYVKELQASVKVLEDQKMERTVESVVLIKKAQLAVEDDGYSSSSDENFDGQPLISQKPFPEIEAKVSGKTVLVRIHCENRKGVLVKTLSEIENSNLTITNTNVMPFLGSSINITVTAQIEEQFPMSVKDLVRKLKFAVG